MLRVAVGWLANVVITFLFSFSIRPLHFQVGFIFGEHDFIALISGAIIVLISWIVAEGHQLSQDQANIV